MGTRCADHVTPLYPQKLALTSPTGGGGRSVGIVRVRTKATEFKNVNIGEYKFISKAQNFNKSSNAIKIRKRDDSDQSVTKIYDMLSHFYYVFQIKTKKNR